jgi:hypothetical protein
MQTQRNSHHYSLMHLAFIPKSIAIFVQINNKPVASS